ncbi:MAG: protein kinase [Melioribacteraceae bacterium]|nr:protein kinase [Melioribacteraceae bacterium]
MIGETILHYKIVGQIGQGGMGEVYLGEDTKLGRKVAIKFLPRQFALDEVSKERLIREAQSASALNHHNVCTIHSIEEFRNVKNELPELFIVMEYVSGTTLRKKNEEGPQKINDALIYAIQIAEALTEAHIKGIAHLDIKSDNVMINSQNQVKVMDFGLAKFRSEETDRDPTEYSGTVAYMSPEQALGLPAGFPSDIWSLGVVLYEIITGKLPFIHEYEEAIIYSIVNEEPDPPSSLRSDITPDLEKIIMTCLEKETEKRYRDAQMLLAELKKVKKEIDSAFIRKSFQDEQKKEVKKETEQKQATIVFIKIKEYSEMLDKLGHEDFVLLLEKCYAVVNTIVLKYGGTINKTHMSELILYFGLPVAIENSSLKALNAVREISTSFSDLGKENNLSLSLAIGVNTGIVIAGSISSGSKMEYTVIGDAVEITSKLLELCKGGQILVGPITYRYTKDNFRFKSTKSLVLKGKRDPVKVYQLESLNIKTDQSSGISRLIHSEMVGRKEELQKLESLLANAINGEGQIINIIADAGIGKSRLLVEFLKNDLLEETIVLQGKAVSTAKNTSFYPVIEILKKWAHINETDDENIAFSKLENSIRRLFNEEADEIIPFIATIMGFRLSGDYEKRVKEVSGDSLNKLIQRSMRLLVLKGSELKPVVFIIEDLHWADQTSIELLQSLLRLTENNRILFVSTFRTTFQEISEGFLSGIKAKYPLCYTEIKLNPLNGRDRELLLQNLLRTELPVQLKNSVSKITEGNPFFIEEVIRSLIDDNIIEIKNDQFVISKHLDNIFIPGTIKDLLLSRIDKLEEPVKNLLKIASVIGRYFLYEILIKIAGKSEEIFQQINILEKLELINENTASKEKEYLFKHALVQEAVYETLLPRNKQELHLKVANAVEELYSERIHDFYETLAYHYNLADDGDKAEEYLIKAGQRTMQAAASYEALNYFQEALKLYLQKYGAAAHKEKIFMLEKNIGFAFYYRGYFHDAVEHFNKALQARGVKVQKNNITQILKALFDLFMLVKHLYVPTGREKIPDEEDNELFDILYKNVTAYANYDGKKMFFELVHLTRLKIGYKLVGEVGWETYASASSLFCYSGISFHLSKKFIEKASESAHINKVEEIYNTGYDELVYYCLSGNWKSFSTINEKLLDYNLRSGEIIKVIYQICWALYVTICRGDYSYSEYLIKKGNDVNETFDFDFGKLFVLSMSGDLALHRRNLKQAIAIYSDACELAAKLGVNTWIIGLSGKRAKAYILLNEHPAANESLDIAEKALYEADTLTPMLLSYYVAYKLYYNVMMFETKSAENQIGKNELHNLEKEIKKSIKAAVKVSNKVAEIKPEVLRFIAQYHFLKKNPKKGFNYFQKSIDYANYLGALPEVGRSYFELGKVLSRTNYIYKKMSADYCMSEAQKIFEQLNLKWDLDKIVKMSEHK